MVATLIKHELIRTKAMLLVIAAAATLSAVFGSLIAATQWPLFAQLGAVLAFIATAGLVPVIQLALAVDYWKTGYRRIGYFTQTLPVKSSTIFWAKLAWACLVSIVSAVWALVLGALVFMGGAVLLGHHPSTSMPKPRGCWRPQRASLPGGAGSRHRSLLWCC